MPKKVTLKLLDAVDDGGGAFEDGDVVDREVGKCRLVKVILPPKDNYLALQKTTFSQFFQRQGSIQILAPDLGTALGRTKISGWEGINFAPRNVGQVSKIGVFD